LDTTFLIIFYVATVVPTLLLVKETKPRLKNIKNGARSLVYLPLTVGILMTYVIFAAGLFSTIPILNWSWLGYNIALGPSADQGFWGVVPFIPMLVYMLIHVNYFEELYFRKSVLLTVLWAFLHIAMGVAVHVALALLPIGFFYKYLYKKRGLDHAYALHFATNIIIVAVSMASYFVQI
jgi:membrane protease YdiL (CAAX protease family)